MKVWHCYLNPLRDTKKEDGPCYYFYIGVLDLCIIERRILFNFKESKENTLAASGSDQLKNVKVLRYGLHDDDKNKEVIE